jgi:cystathionine beta-lyase/cystathionine gamma-synthase
LSAVKSGRDPAGGGRGASTRAVHAGETQALPRRPAVVPVYQTAPFLFTGAAELNDAFAGGDLTGLYSRYANPTVRAVEEKIAALEGGEDGVAFASGMAAITATLSALLRSGDRLLAAADLYGGTHAWLGWLADHHPEIVIERVPTRDLVAHLEQHAGAATAGSGGSGQRTDAESARDRNRGISVVYFETPINPVLTCCDIARAARAGHAAGARVVVDNTFASPVLQQPLALGADLVVHSATKFLGGHSDVTAGLVVGNRELLAPIREAMILGGGCLDPHAAFLVGRGMKTVALRVERQSENAARLVAALRDDPRVERVCYPGLDPIGIAQMRAGGGMFAFDLRGGGAAAARFVDALQVFQIYPSLGGVESGVLLPAATSHRQLTPDQRAAAGIAAGTVRVSCGIEDADDLLGDFRQALAAADHGSD